MAEALIAMEPQLDFDNIPQERREMMAWFATTSDDPIRRGTMFGAASMSKLKEFGNVAAWVEWLKTQFDEADRTSRALTERELKRVPTAAGDNPKWELTLRFHTFSHSIRPKPLNRWSEGLTA
jgi:hypothetical protein